MNSRPKWLSRQNGVVTNQDMLVRKMSDRSALTPPFQWINPLDSKSNYSATSNDTKLVHWSLMGRLLHLVQ